MPPDVFLMLCSSGIAFVASLLFFVSDERPPPERAGGEWVTYRLPPLRPKEVRWSIDYSGGLSHCRMTLMCVDGEWRVALEAEPMADAPARQVTEAGGVLRTVGAVHDLRWHGRAGLATSARGVWKPPTARA